MNFFKIFLCLCFSFTHKRNQHVPGVCVCVCVCVYVCVSDNCQVFKTSNMKVSVSNPCRICIICVRIQGREFREHVLKSSTYAPAVSNYGQSVSSLSPLSSKQHLQLPARLMQRYSIDTYIRDISVSNFGHTVRYSV